MQVGCIIAMGSGATVKVEQYNIKQYNLHTEKIAESSTGSH